MAVKTFTTGEVLTAADTNTYLNNGGLVYISETTVSGGSTGITVSNCFSSTYDNYRIIIRSNSSSGTASHYIQLSAATGNTYYMAGYYLSWTVATQTIYSPAVTNLWYGSTNLVANIPTVMIYEINGPYLAARTYGRVTGEAGNGVFLAQLQESSSAQSTGFTLLKAGETMTGTTITVYGYRKA